MNKKRVQKILEQNKKNWQIIAKTFSKTRKENWNKSRIPLEYIKDGQKVLDLGCGNGRLYQLFQDKEVEYVGVDNSEGLIKLAREQFNRPEFIVADALDLENRFPSNEFDVIISIAFLHHIPSKELRFKVLKDCFSLLKPNGFLIFTVWNLKQWKLICRYHLYSLFFGKRDVFVPWKATEKKIWRYHHVFTLREIRRLAEKAGFKIIRNEKDSPKGFNLITIVQKI